MKPLSIVFVVGGGFFTLSHIKGKEGIDWIWQVVKQFIQAAISSSPASFSFPILKALTICSVPGSQGETTMERNEITLSPGRQVEGDEGFSNDFKVITKSSLMHIWS